jgi:DNA mismatch repair protein MutL
MKMGNIKILTEDLANKIAAGEVVEKYVSVVKELVENSIDAGSTKIKIDLIESGLKEIKVTDNGKGMNYADALLAFSSHATSKIINEEDLYAISSLGFRGEALPSIAAVSEVTLKTSDGQEGTVLNIKGGKLINEEKGDLRQGTIVTVKNIFYNTPARLKHLSSLYREYAYIIDYINKIALSYPNIAFTLSNDNKISLNTDGSGNQLKVIKEIYGVNITKKMILIEGENNDYDINGYISYPEVTKSNRNHIITLVNNRVVRNLELNRIIIDAYHTYIPHDKYPIVILNINVDPTLVDVNIHPTKLDIKFSQFAELKELVNNVIKEQLMKIRLIPEVEAKQKEQVQPQYEEISFNLERLVEEAPTFYNEVENKEIKTNINEDEKIPEIYPVGLVQGTYIICQNELGMYIIDQHAAQERINYEYYFKKIGNPEVNITSLLLPLNIELPSNEFLIIKQNLDVLNNLGIEIEEIGINTLMVRSHPIWLLEGYEEESIRKIIDLLVVMEKDFNLEKFNEAIAITLSCKMAIKANENISIKEMETLINKLRLCKNPWTCPHGRPTIIHYSNYELEKLFKRVIN